MNAGIDLMPALDLVKHPSCRQAIASKEVHAKVIFRADDQFVRKEPETSKSTFLKSQDSFTVSFLCIIFESINLLDG